MLQSIRRFIGQAHLPVFMLSVHEALLIILGIAFRFFTQLYFPLLLESVSGAGPAFMNVVLRGLRATIEFPLHPMLNAVREPCPQQLAL